MGRILQEGQCHLDKLRLLLAAIPAICFGRLINFMFGVIQLFVETMFLDCTLSWGTLSRAGHSQSRPQVAQPGRLETNQTICSALMPKRFSDDAADGRHNSAEAKESLLPDVSYSQHRTVSVVQILRLLGRILANTPYSKSLYYKFSAKPLFKLSLGGLKHPVISSAVKTLPGDDQSPRQHPRGTTYIVGQSKDVGAREQTGAAPTPREDPRN